MYGGLNVSYFLGQCTGLETVGTPGLQDWDWIEKVTDTLIMATDPTTGLKRPLYTRSGSETPQNSDRSGILSVMTAKLKGLYLKAYLWLYTHISPFRRFEKRRRDDIISMLTLFVQAHRRAQVLSPPIRNSLTN